MIKKPLPPVYLFLKKKKFTETRLLQTKER
jgi:hypothetical protein